MEESLGCLEWSPQPLALISVLYRAVGGEQMSLEVLWGAIDFLCDLSEPSSIDWEHAFSCRGSPIFSGTPLSGTHGQEQSFLCTASSLRDPLMDCEG